MQTKDPTTLVIVAVGSALVVLFAGASIVLANGNQVPTELWAAAGALSGALVAMLVPPGGPAAAMSQAAAREAGAHAHGEAVAEAARAEKPLIDAAAQPDSTEEAKRKARAAAAAVDEVRASPTVAAARRAIGRRPGPPRAAAAGAAAVALKIIGAAADDAAAKQQIAEKGPAHGDVDPDQLAEASARKMVLDAAVAGAKQAQAGSITAGIAAAAETMNVAPPAPAIELKVALSLVIGALAFVRWHHPRAAGGPRYVEDDDGIRRRSEERRRHSHRSGLGGHWGDARTEGAVARGQSRSLRAWRRLHLPAQGSQGSAHRRLCAFWCKPSVPVRAGDGGARISVAMKAGRNRRPTAVSQMADKRVPGAAPGRPASTGRMLHPAARRFPTPASPKVAPPRLCCRPEAIVCRPV